MRKEENICQYCTRQRAITTLSLNASWNQIWQGFFYLLTNCLIQCNINLTQTSRSKSYKYQSCLFIFPNIRQLCISILWFKYFVLYSIAFYFFFNWFVFEHSVFVRVSVLSKHSITFENTYLKELLISLCWHFFHRI